MTSIRYKANPTPFLHFSLSRLAPCFLIAVVLALLPQTTRATYYWDADGDASTNNCGTGLGMGGTGSWEAAGVWLDSGDGSDPYWCTNTPKAWSDGGSTAVFWGTAGTVTLGAAQTAGGLTFKTGSYTVTGSTLTLNGDAKLISETGTALISSTVSGTGGYKVIGPGTIRLTTTANNIAGPILVTNAGTLRLASASPIGSWAAGAGEITLEGGTLRNDATAAAPVFMTPNRGIVIGSNGGTLYTSTTPDYASAVGVYIQSAVISGTGLLTKVGAGELRAYGANTFPKLKVSAGTFCCTQASTGSEQGFGAVPASYTADAITLSVGGIVAGAKDVTVNANRGITIESGGGSFITRSSSITFRIDSIITGPGALYFNGENSTGKFYGGSAGELQVRGLNTYQGNTYVRFGTLRIAAGSERLPATTIVQLGSTNTAAAKLALGLTTTPRTQTLSGLLVAADAAGPASVVNGASTATTAATLVISNAADFTFSGVLGGPGANEDNLKLVKTASGSLTLSGVNTYTNSTTVSNGTLVVSGSINSSQLINVYGGVLALGANDVLSDNATVNLAGGTMDMGGSDTVAMLLFDGLPQVAGTYGAAGSGATHESARFTGTGVLTVTMTPTALLLVSTPTPSAPGSNVTFTATVSSVAGTPTGDVIFSASGTPFSTNALVSGVAQASNALLPLGTNSIVAAFAAQGGYGPSSMSLSQVVKVLEIQSQTNYIVGISDDGSGTATLTFQGTPLAEYYVVSSADATAAMAAWTAVTGSTNVAPSPSGIWTLNVGSTSGPRFYRSVATHPAP